MLKNAQGRNRKPDVVLMAYRMDVMDAIGKERTSATQVTNDSKNTLWLEMM